MAKRPGRKKRFGSISIISDGVRWFGGYCPSCDEPHYLTREQMDQLKIYYHKSRRSLKKWVITRLSD